MIKLTKELSLYDSDIEKILKVFPLIQYHDLKELLYEYLENKELAFNLIDNNKKIICISEKYNKFLYDKTGNTTYITDELNPFKLDINTFKLFDKILEINNKYSKYEDIILSEYDYAYIYDDTPKYRFIKENNNVYTIIHRLLLKNRKIKVIFHTDYKKISNMKQSKRLIIYLSKVILDDETSYVLYEKKQDNKVSIINYNKEKISSIDKLKQIINNDRKQKDILVKTTHEDIIDNFYRIGFRLYQSKIIEETKNINEIVDENTKLIEELSIINKKIEEDLNKLINK